MNNNNYFTSEQYDLSVERTVEFAKAQQKAAKAVYDKLKADFPAEAYSIDNSRGFALTSVKAQYIIERFNDVLGLNGWNFGGTYEKVDGGVIFHGQLMINIVTDKGTVTHTVTGVGSAAENKKNVGDIYKSARTDALSKSASQLGVANDVFKGLVDPTKLGKTTVKAAPKTTYNGAAKTAKKSSFSKNLNKNADPFA